MRPTRGCDPSGFDSSCWSPLPRFRLICRRRRSSLPRTAPSGDAIARARAGKTGVAAPQPMAGPGAVTDTTVERPICLQLRWWRRFRPSPAQGRAGQSVTYSCTNGRLRPAAPKSSDCHRAAHTQPTDRPQAQPAFAPRKAEGVDARPVRIATRHLRWRAARQNELPTGLSKTSNVY
jgi:hypothetical protein